MITIPSLTERLLNADMKVVNEVVRLVARKAKKKIASGNGNYKEFMQTVATKLHSPGYEEVLNKVVNDVLK
jgi:hypothetical protein